MDDGLLVPASSEDTVVTAALPTIHPTMNPALVTSALGVRNIRMTARIGNGETATTNASGRSAPPSVPRAHPQHTAQDAACGQVAAAVGRRPNQDQRPSSHTGRRPGRSHDKSARCDAPVVTPRHDGSTV